MYLAWREKKCCWFRQALMRHFLKCFEVFRQKALRPKLTQADGFILGVGAKSPSPAQLSSTALPPGWFTGLFIG